MCIFCGGTCGGVVDMALPSVATAASLVILKVKASKASRKSSKDEEEKRVDDAEGGEE